MLARFGRKVLNLPALWLRRRLWRIHPERWLGDLGSIPIDRPIFLLGVQGGGLTVITRMLRRSAEVVCVTGNHHYWAGPDEMQNVMGPLLPLPLTGLHHNVPPHSDYPERDWLYATDELLPLYRQTKATASANLAEEFKRAIRLAIAMHGSPPWSVRFIDKSQSFTVRVAFINTLLNGHEPHFVLVTRNPYAVCYRAAIEKTPLSRLPREPEARLQLAAEHWTNSFHCALSDSAEVAYWHVVRFEDVLRDPETHVRALCDFAGLGFHTSMLPAPDHTFPLGATGSSSGDAKWYPLRPDVNRKHLEHVEPWMVDVLNERVAALAHAWKYTPEGP